MIVQFFAAPQFARTRSLSAAMLCAALAGCGFGLLMPLVALNLEAMTQSGAVVGANAAAAALSTLIATPLIPPLLARVKARPTVVVCALVIAAGFIAFPAFADPVIWFFLRFGAGLAVTVIFVVSETWINQLAKPESRASLLAVYATILSGGFGSGGLLLAVLGSEGWMPWIAGAFMFFLGSIPILLLRGPDVSPPDHKDAGVTALIDAARLAPVAMLAGVIFGALETGVFSLLPVYADRIGFTESGVGLLVAVGALGAMAMQIPIGRFADSHGRRQTLTLVAISAVILPLIIAAMGANLWALIPMVFLFVGAASAFYTIGLALIGESVKPGALASANAAFIFAYGAGSLIGPPAGGAAMDAANPWGLMVIFAGFAALYLAGAFAAKRR